MRTLLLMVVAMLAFSGCLDDDSNANAGTESDNTGDETPSTQEPLQFSGSMLSPADPVGTGLLGQCAFPGSCVNHDFTVDADGTHVELVLVSTDGTVTGVTAGPLYGSDYDLFLYEGSNLLGESTNPDVEQDIVEATLDAGTYTAQVYAWNDVDGSYQLDITFS